MDIRAWLSELGLGQYTETFEENAIDSEVLHTLSADDLKELGVHALGHRKKLLAAIAALDDRSAPTPRTESAAPASGAERRQLSVMFVDLVGSTALSQSLDPEDMQEVIRGYHDAVAGEVARFDGHVAKYMGDGVLAYFGWPRAHEDDAERVVRAALAVIEAVRRCRPSATPLRSRIGIATGLAVVGDLIGEGAAREEAVVGETPNLAARLQKLARPDSVVIGDSTRQLLGRLFELEDLGPQGLKGFAEPLVAWRVAGDNRAVSRFDAFHTEHLAPLVGREHELALLLERWARAKEGDGQVVLLSGEPGIGKSRLLRELRARLETEPCTPLSQYCSPYHVTSALHPVIGHLKRAAGFERSEAPEARLARLEALLAQGARHLDEALPLIAHLLGIECGECHLALDLSPQRQKQRTLELLVEQLEGLAGRQPLLVIYEDVHWADPTTLELLGLVVERVRTLPALVVITFRAGFPPPWTAHAHVTQLSLARLTRRHGTAMVETLAGGKALPAAVLDQVLARTDGVPLFVEELTKTVLESGLLDDAGDRYRLIGTLPELAIPATLHDSLIARLDRSASAKEVAQIAAVIGREFPHGLLAAVAPVSADELGTALQQLVNAELVFRRGNPPDALYTFKHALVRDAAYHSLLKSRRKALHARIASTLEQSFADLAESQPELLAQHFTDAGLADPAIAYWRKAGGRAAGRSANVEAIAHLRKGLELLENLPDAGGRAEEEFAFRLAIGGLFIATSGHAVPEVEEHYLRARTLCEQLGRSEDLFPVLRGLWNCYLVRGELELAHDLAEQLVPLAEADGASLRRALARRALGTSHFFYGRLIKASEALNEGIMIDDAVEVPDDPGADLLLYTERAGVTCRLYSAWACWFRGFPDRALHKMETALALGHPLQHVHSVAFALNFAANLHIFRREFEPALERATAAVEISRAESPMWLAQAILCRGYALAGLGQSSEGIAQLRAGLTAWMETGARLLNTHWLGLTSEAHARAGDFDAALAALDEAARIERATGECHYRPELYRLRGVVLTAAGEPADEAERWLQRAIQTARARQAKSLELRAATSLAGLWAEQGERQKAVDLLAPVYGWFTEGFDTADLKDATALLDALR